MIKKRKCWPSNQTLLMIYIAFNLLMGVVMTNESSLPNEETFVFESVKSDENLDDFCSQELCQELRGRVETMEEAVRIIVSTLLEEKNPHITNILTRKIGKHSALRSVLIIPPLPSAKIKQNQAENTEKEVNHHQSQIGRASEDAKLNSTDSIKDVNDFLVSSNSVNQLKFAVKCSQAHILDINVSANSNANHSAGILSATLLHHSSASSSEKSIEIEWSPPLASCIEFVTGLWVRFYESGTEPSSQPYLSIPKKCLISKRHPSGREVLISNLLISSNSSIAHDNDECFFSTRLINCYAYQVEVIPDYQSLRGKLVRSSEIIIFPTKIDTETRLMESYLKNVSAQHDSLEFSWEDIAGCPLQLTSIILRLWPDGLVPSQQQRELAKQNKANRRPGWNSASISIPEPITYIIPRRHCLQLSYYEKNNSNLNMKLSYESLFSTCDRNHTDVKWKSLSKCRMYLLEIESLYSPASITGPSFSQTIFTSSRSSPSLTQVDSSLLQYPIDLTGSWNCSTGRFFCHQDHYQSTKCLSYHYICDGKKECLDPKTKPIYEKEIRSLESAGGRLRVTKPPYNGIYIDEQNCTNTNNWDSCGSNFRCGQQCILKKLVCDGKYDCLNGEDETYTQCDYLNSCKNITASRSYGVFQSLKPIVNIQDANASNNTRPSLIRKHNLLISAKPNQVILADLNARCTPLDSSDNNYRDILFRWKTKVKLYDGPFSTSRVLSDYDGYYGRCSVVSTGPNMYVEYYSYQEDERVFKAYYTTKEKTELPVLKDLRCGGYINAINGGGVIAMSPKQYETIAGDIAINSSSTILGGYPSDQCFWFMESSHVNGTVILRTDYNFKLRDSITVYDGWNTTGTVLYDKKIPTNFITIQEEHLIMRSIGAIYSLSNKILVRFNRPKPRSSQEYNLLSWDVTSTYTPNYIDQNLTESSGTINSPNYPEPYPKSVDCRWTITTAPGSTIQILFAFFQTQEKRDFVYVYDGPTVYHPLLMEKSGTISVPFSINSSSNQLLVRFASDVGESFNGFLAVYSLL